MIERKVKTVRALERGLDVLEEVQRRRGASLHELHCALGLPKATLLRMLVTLAKHGHVWQRLADNAYLPSAAAGPRRPDASLEQIAEVASPHLKRLSDQVAWPSVLAAPRLDHIEIIETNSSLLRLDSVILGPIGSRLSYIHTATGRAYLAACEEGEREAIIARLRPTDDVEDGDSQIRAIIAEIQTRGYSLREPFHPWPDRNWRAVRHDGRRSMAVPVIVGGRPVASVNITWLLRRSETDTVVKRHFGALRRTAEAIAAELTTRSPAAA